MFIRIITITRCKESEDYSANQPKGGNECVKVEWNIKTWIEKKTKREHFFAKTRAITISLTQSDNGTKELQLSMLNGYVGLML